MLMIGVHGSVLLPYESYANVPSGLNLGICQTEFVSAFQCICQTNPTSSEYSRVNSFISMGYITNRQLQSHLQLSSLRVNRLMSEEWHPYPKSVINFLIYFYPITITYTYNCCYCNCRPSREQRNQKDMNHTSPLTCFVSLVYGLSYSTVSRVVNDNDLIICSNTVYIRWWLQKCIKIKMETWWRVDTFHPWLAFLLHWVV